MKQKIRSLLKKIIPEKYRHKLVKFYRYFGFEFKCPFCGKNLRKLKPAGKNNPVLKEKKVVGGGYRLNAKCPYCYSSDRERLIYLYLLKKTNIFNQPLKMLHVAPERILQKVLMAQSNIDYISIDLNSPLSMYKMDIANIGYINDIFDVIICNHVLEHVLDDQKAMSELYRVLKPGGWAILQTPISLSLEKTHENPSIITPEERSRVFGQRDHVRIYAKDYKERLEKIGFSVIVYNIATEFGGSFTRKYALLKDENVYVCLKPIIET